MRIFKALLDFYINTSIHVAVAVFSLVQITKLSLNIATNSNLDCFIFFGTVLGYNFLKYFEVFRTQIFTFKKNYLIVLVSLIAFFGMLFYLFQLESITQISFFKIGLVIFLYPFLRKYGLIKILLVAFCVSWITVYIPFLNQKSDLNWMFLWQRFVIVICLLIPLEICDLEIDSKTITTLPQQIGIENTKITGYFLLIVFCFLLFEFLNLLFAIVTSIAIFFSNENHSKYYTSFWVESIPIFWWLFLVVFME